MTAHPLITDVRVQDISAGTWWTYHEGAWDHQPITVKNPNNPLYIAAWAVNHGSEGTCYISVRRGSTVLKEKTENVYTGSGIGVEASTIVTATTTYMAYTFPPPNSAYADTLSFNVTTEIPTPECATSAQCVTLYGQAPEGYRWECQSGKCVKVKEGNGNGGKSFPTWDFFGFQLPVQCVRKLWKLREKYVRPEVHRKLHPLI